MAIAPGIDERNLINTMKNWISKPYSLGERFIYSPKSSTRCPWISEFLQCLWNEQDPFGRFVGITNLTKCFWFPVQLEMSTEPCDPDGRTATHCGCSVAVHQIIECGFCCGKSPDLLEPHWHRISIYRCNRLNQIMSPVPFSELPTTAALTIWYEAYIGQVQYILISKSHSYITYNI